MNHIKYISYYSGKESKEEKRSCFPAAQNKIEYICKVLHEIEYRVTIVSASVTEDTKGYFGKVTKINDKTEIRYFRTFATGKKIKRIISVLSMRLFLFLYMLTTINKDETVLVYHSLGYASIVAAIKKIKKFRLVYEVEEIYTDVGNFSEKQKKKERRHLSCADGYIFSTEFLNYNINTDHKPHAIVYGTYQVEKDRQVRIEDGKIHVLYAGTFDVNKGGADMAVMSGEYLSENFHLHIIGFGSEEDVRRIKSEISQVRQKTKAEVTYDGVLEGEEYIYFLQKCDIGLSTQKPEEVFNNSSFPSKILSYLSNGLQVVSARIPVVEESAIGGLINYYEKHEPHQIAEAICRASIRNDSNNRMVIEQLDRQFRGELRQLLNS